MRKLGYDTPGSRQDLKVFKVNLTLKSKEELLLIIGNVAAACDMEGKGYVNEWEDDIRHAIGYIRGHGEDHAKECGCSSCEKEHVGIYANKKRVLT